ncbi:MAG TPA: TPM domain-containing protein [Balneolaceae bacterium]|nr:TPM domain-containing protein [Balneolaceae bacterium]
MPSQKFLTESQERQIIKAIEKAEQQTSGEVRVHIEHHCKGEPLERAARIFQDLGMNQTELQNGVLIYIADEDHKAAVYAGKGIYNQVENDFWSDVLHILTEHFKKGEYEKGIIAAVTKAGAKLFEMFPYQKADIDELSNDISYNDNQS